MVQFYKIIKLTVAVITTASAIASIPASPTHTAKEQCRNITTACHPRWKTTQEENATNRIIKRRVELLTSNTSLKRPITKQPTKTTTTKIYTTTPSTNDTRRRKKHNKREEYRYPNLQHRNKKTPSDGTTQSSKHLTWPSTLH